MQNCCAIVSLTKWSVDCACVWSGFVWNFNSQFANDTTEFKRHTRHNPFIYSHNIGIFSIITKRQSDDFDSELANLQCDIDSINNIKRYNHIETIKTRQIHFGVVFFKFCGNCIFSLDLRFHWNSNKLKIKRIWHRFGRVDYDK